MQGSLFAACLGGLVGWVFWVTISLWPPPMAFGLGDRIRTFQEGGTTELPIDRQLGECIDRDPTTAGMVRCAVEARQAWEQELQRTYEALLQGLNPRDRPYLQKAQEAWVTFRNAESAWILRLYELPEGTMYGVLRSSDLMALVRERAVRLQSYLSSIRPESGPPDRVQPGEEGESESPIDRRLRACLEQTPTTASMVRCQEEALRAWDRELNRVYQALRRELDPQKLQKKGSWARFGLPWPDPLLGRRELRSAQRAWLAYRDAELAWIGRLYGRREDPRSALAEVGGRLSLVRTRVQKLGWYLCILQDLPSDQDGQ